MIDSQAGDENAMVYTDGSVTGVGRTSEGSFSTKISTIMQFGQSGANNNFQCENRDLDFHLDGYLEIVIWYTCD